LSLVVSSKEFLDFNNDVAAPRQRARLEALLINLDKLPKSEAR
jgi:hypothetical protein